MGLKKKKITWDEYKKQYADMMGISMEIYEEAWLDLLRGDEATLVCYCTTPRRCHRTLLAEMLVAFGEKHGIDVRYVGERGAKG